MSFPAEHPHPTEPGNWPPEATPGPPYPMGLIPPAGVPESRRYPLLAGLAVLVGLVLLGLPFGLLWRAVAPGVPLVKTADGAVAAEPEPEEFIAADGWFILLGLGLGILAAIAVWVALRRLRGPVAMLALTFGGVGAALVAWRVGRLIGLSDYRRLLDSAPEGQRFTKPPDLRTAGVDWALGVLPVPHGSLLLPAFGAVITYTLLAGWSRWPGLRPEPEPPFGPEPPR
ncbi:DUF2567 domain-containing protein [Plantactinospora sp. GCM10030261]|uniref:DUF2567 domain-containing protein n=1 Tax=Plantactinospora sp. GCM10030261 TaxID=3273420 RepID=UPI003621C8C4